MSKIHLYHTFCHCMHGCLCMCIHVSECVHVCLHEFVYVCMCVHACMCLCVCMNTHAHVCVDLCHWPPPYLRQGPLLFSAESARVADPRVSGNFTLSVSHLPLGLDKWFCNGSYKDLGHSNSSSYAYIAITLPLSHLPSPVTLILHLFIQTIPELKGIPPQFLPSWFQNFLFMFSL